MIIMDKSNIGDQCNADQVRVSVDDFGIYRRAYDTDNDSNSHSSDELIKQFTFRTASDMEVRVITYGATITCIRVPDNAGQVVDVLLGYDRLEQLRNDASLKLGSIVNVCATDDHQQTGECLSTVNWQYHLEECTLYLGTLYNDTLITCTFTVTNDNLLHIAYEAIANTPSHINLTSNLYFNLAGHQAQCRRLYKQILVLNADKYLTNKVHENNDGDGECVAVGGTPYDMRIAHRIGSFIKKTPSFGYDNTFVLSKDLHDVAFVGRLCEPERGIVMDILSDANVCRVETANRWPYSQHALPGGVCGSQKNESVVSRVAFVDDNRTEVLLEKLCDVERLKVMEEDGAAKCVLFTADGQAQNDAERRKSTIKCVDDYEASPRSSGSSISEQCDTCRRPQYQEKDSLPNAFREEFSAKDSARLSDFNTPYVSSVSSISSLDSDNGRIREPMTVFCGKNGIEYKRHCAIGIFVLSARDDKQPETTQTGCLFRHKVIYKFIVVDNQL